MSRQSAYWLGLVPGLAIGGGIVGMIATRGANSVLFLVLAVGGGFLAAVCASRTAREDDRHV